MKKMLELAKKTLQKGGLVIFPTETVYGLGGDATNNIALKKIFKLKKRPRNNPLICHFKNIKEVKKNCKIKTLDEKLINLFWPGPLTLILEKKKASQISPLVSNSMNFIGCRIPNNKTAKSLLNLINFPIAAPSANIATKISSTHPLQLLKYFKKKVFILDGGRSKLGLESTVIKTFNKRIKILRLGSVSIEEIKSKLPNVKIIMSNNKSKISPGNQKKHYAPNLPIRINVKKIKKNESLLNFGKNNLKSNICEYNLSYSGNLKEASKNFFYYLHLLDNTKCSKIAVAPIPNYGLGKTINDKLKRASYKKNN